MESYFTVYETLMLFDSVPLMSLQYMRHWCCLTVCFWFLYSIWDTDVVWQCAFNFFTVFGYHWHCCWHRRGSWYCCLLSQWKQVSSLSFLKEQSRLDKEIVFITLAFICHGYNPWDKFFIYHCNDITMDHNAILLKWH